MAISSTLEAFVVDGHLIIAVTDGNTERDVHVLCYSGWRVDALSSRRRPRILAEYVFWIGLDVRRSHERSKVISHSEVIELEALFVVQQTSGEEPTAGRWRQSDVRLSEKKLSVLRSMRD